MTYRQQANHIPHFGPLLLAPPEWRCRFVRPYRSTSVRSPSLNSTLYCQEVHTIHPAVAKLPRCSIFDHAEHGVPSRSLDFFQRCICGVASWRQHCRFRVRNKSKASGQLAAVPTKWSDRSSQTSPTRSGRQTPQQISLRNAAAACARLKDISEVSANGRARQSPRSSLKSSSVIECGT